MAEERVQKLLARAGYDSRRAVEDLIRARQVTINGRVAALGDKADPDKDTVKVGGKRVELAPPEPRYLLLNKPVGVMSTVEDPEGRPTVMELVPPALRKGLFPVGRLDFMTSGLLILTNDGAFALRVSHPRYGCAKTYEVKVKGRPDENALRKLRTGISIEGRRTAPATVEERQVRHKEASEENTWWTVSLNEGRTRQLREMFLRIGHPVQKLRRVAIGGLRDRKLPLGFLRDMTPREVAELARGGIRPPAPKARQRSAKKDAAPRVEKPRPAAGKSRR